MVSVIGAEGRGSGASAGAPMMYSIRHIRSSPENMEEWIGSSRSTMSANIQSPGDSDKVRGVEGLIIHDGRDPTNIIPAELGT
jgi:hypothetical protein